MPLSSTLLNSVLPHVKSSARIVDVGCGQGELVEYLRRSGHGRAFGFDPVLRNPSAYLFAEYWSPERFPADLVVLRCVLPHIPRPWDFLRGVADHLPDSLVLVEFQDLEWIVDNKVWFGLTHDHVNMFTLPDFESRFELLAKGRHSGGEWAWALFRPSTEASSSASDHGPVPGIEDLDLWRRHHLDWMCQQHGDIVVWGAAGKGTVLCYEANRLGLDVTAVDADSNKWNRYLEASGAKVLAPADFLRTDVKRQVVVVSNPRHLEEVCGYLGNAAHVVALSGLFP